MSDIHILLLPRPASIQAIRDRLKEAYQLSPDRDLGEVEELNVCDGQGRTVCVIENLQPYPPGKMEKDLHARGAEPEKLQGFVLRYCKWPAMNDVLVRLANSPDAWIYPATEIPISGAEYAARTRADPNWNPLSQQRRT
jgi:hypothetical protein